MYRLKAFEQFYYLTFPDDLTFNYMMLLSSYARRHRIRYFPISWREEDQRSNVRMVSQSFRVLGLLASFMIDRTRFLATGCTRTGAGSVPWNNRAPARRRMSASLRVYLCLLASLTLGWLVLQLRTAGAGWPEPDLLLAGAIALYVGSHGVRMLRLGAADTRSARPGACRWSARMR